MVGPNPAPPSPIPRLAVVPPEYGRTVELILVRHGEPLWVVDGKNRNDPELTERGHAQAARVATRLADPEVEPADGPVDVLLGSPARRAQETCAPIAAAL